MKSALPDQFLTKFKYLGSCQAFSLRVHTKKLILLFLNQNKCCGYSKEPSQWDGSFEQPKHVLKIMGMKIFTILRWKFLFV